MTAITDNVDFERALMLMNIVEQISKVAPSFTSLSGAAMTELKEMNDEIKALVDEESRRLAAEAHVAPPRELYGAPPAGSDQSVTGGPDVAAEPEPADEEYEDEPEEEVVLGEKHEPTTKRRL